MVGEERASNDGGGGGALVGSDREAVNVNRQMNGFVAQIENGHLVNGNSGGSSGEGFRTYKRRKRTQAVENGKVLGNSTTRIKEKSAQEMPDMVVQKCLCPHPSVGVGSHVSTNASDNCSVKNCRNVVLQQICESLVGEGGLRESIQDAFLIHSESGCTSVVKESVHSCEDGRKCISLSGPGQSHIQNAVRGAEDLRFNVSVDDTNCHRVTELCQRTFSDVITSEKFALLCSVLLKNFQGMKTDKFFDISLINSRMKEGAYESLPTLFFSDIQQVWSKIQNVGSEIVVLAKNLLEKSRTSYQEQVGDLVHGASDDGAVGLVAQESGMHAKVEQTEACGLYKVCTCKCCKGEADGRDCLVCDSCEEMYHVSCIQPAVKEIPLRSWYCASCTAKGIESPHDKCVVCERLNASRSLAIMDGVDQLTNTEVSVELEESSNDLMEDDLQLSEGVDMPCCNVCRTDVQPGEKLRICGHPFCPHKFYHARCLTSKQLNSYGPRWYCPSCLCRVCLTDRDDEKIVLCDACDHAYHIYCMQPPRSMIPRGKWFCKKCDTEIRRICKARRTYESLQNKLRKQSEEGKVSSEENQKIPEPLDKSGGVDMLLNAARTLKYEENLAAMGIKS